jgi:hypothetical protein
MDMARISSKRALPSKPSVSWLLFSESSDPHDGFPEPADGRSVSILKARSPDRASRSRRGCLIHRVAMRARSEKEYRLCQDLECSQLVYGRAAGGRRRHNAMPMTLIAMQRSSTMRCVFSRLCRQIQTGMGRATIFLEVDQLPQDEIASTTRSSLGEHRCSWIRRSWIIRAVKGFVSMESERHAVQQHPDGRLRHNT